MSIGAGPWYIDDTLTFTVDTHQFDTGGLTDADAVPAYRLYEDETTTPILTGNMAKLDDANTTGFYSEQITLSAANGFEVGKSYAIRITAAVNSVTAAQTFNFKVIATPSAAPSAAAIADAVWDEDATGHQTQGSFGQVLGDSGSDSDSIWALTNTNLDAAVSSRMATYTQPTGFLAATFPAGTVANTTNITAGTITTVTNLTNAPTNGDLTTAMKASVNAEADTALADVGLTTTVTGRIDVATSTRMATYVQPTGFLAANFPSDPADQSLIIAATDAITAAIAALNNLSAAQVNAEVDTALADINLDHLVKVAVDTDFPTTVHLGSVIGQLADNGTTATFDRTTDSLEAIRDRGDAAWITATGFSTHSAADVWTSGTRVLTAGTNIVLAKGTGVTGFNDLSAAQVNSEADTALADVGLTTTITARIDVLVSSRAATGAAMTLTSAYDFAKGTVEMTESYAANGVAPTPIQLLYALQQDGQMFTISGTSKTVKRLNNSTTAFVVTLNDATNPTGAART